MRIRCSALVLIGLTILPIAARAAGPHGDVYLGCSRLGASAIQPFAPSLNGWEAEG